MEFWLDGKWMLIKSEKKIKSLLKNKQLIIVHGPIGIGKSVFCKAMSSFNKKLVYCEVQHIDSLDEDFKKLASQCIEINYSIYAKRFHSLSQRH